MSATRNQIWDAALALTASLDKQAGGPLVSRSRKFRHFDKVPAIERPALFQTDHSEVYGQQTGLPYRRLLKGAWTFYLATNPSDLADIGAVQMDDLLDALEACIKPSPAHGNRQTLGGLVHHCFFDGTVLKVPGDDDGTGMVVIPITILAP